MKPFFFLFYFTTVHHLHPQKLNYMPGNHLATGYSHSFLVHKHLPVCFLKKTSLFVIKYITLKTTQTDQNLLAWACTSFKNTCKFKSTEYITEKCFVDSDRWLWKLRPGPQCISRWRVNCEAHKITSSLLVNHFLWLPCVYSECEWVLQ